MTQKILIALAAGLVAASPLAAAGPSGGDAAPTEEARIPFFNYGSFRTFHAVDDDVLYVRDRRNWYRAELMGPCTGLRWARSIGVDSRGSSAFDRFSTLIVDGQRCNIRSLTRSEEPDRRRSSRRKRAS